MTKPQIVFFGTGPVSYATLVGIANVFEVEAVVTKPVAISPHGRPLPHPVLDWANDHEVQTLTPGNKAELGNAFKDRHFISKVGLVVDYGIIIPDSVIESFPLGIVNSHFSLLPELRGADPITAAIISGQQTTGVSLMKIVVAMDEGDLLTTEELAIAPDATTATLTDELVALSNKVIQSTLPEYINASVKPYSQSTKITPTYTNKLQKADGIINWTKSATQIEREIRAYLGWPGSRATLYNRDVIITKAHVAPIAKATDSPGTPIRTETKELAVITGEQLLVIDRLKPAGKGEMTGQAFLSGVKTTS